MNEANAVEPSGSSLRRVGIIVGVLLAVGGVIAGSVTANTASATLSSMPTSLGPTHAPSGEEVESSRQERVNSFPPAQAVEPGAAWVTEKQVTETAKLFAQSPDGIEVELPSDVRQALPAQAVLTDYASVVTVEFDSQGDPDIASDRPVWVVVVHGTIRNDSAILGESVEDMVHDVFTVIYDAPTGSLIAYGAGSDAFKNGLSTHSTLSVPTDR